MLILLLFLPLAEATCPTTLPTDASFAMANQYHAGEYGSASSKHLLAFSNPDPTTYTPAYYLASGAFMKTPSTQCPQACLNRLRAMGKPASDKTISSIVMAWDQGQSPPTTPILFTAYTTTIPPGDYLYCSAVVGTCGATVPLYLYYNSVTDDYQVRGEKDTVDDDKVILSNLGMPICYMFPALTTTSTSTVTNGTHIRHARDVNQTKREFINPKFNRTVSESFFKNQQNDNSSDFFERNSTASQAKSGNKFVLPTWLDTNSTKRSEKNPDEKNRTDDRPVRPTVTYHPPRPTVSWPNRFANDNNTDRSGWDNHNDSRSDNNTHRSARPTVTWPHRSGKNDSEFDTVTRESRHDENRTDRFTVPSKHRFATVVPSEVPHRKAERERTSGAVSMVPGRTPAHRHDANGTAETTKEGNRGNIEQIAAKIAEFGPKMTPKALQTKLDELKKSGLPPANETIDKFLNDVNPAAIEKSIAKAGISLPGNVSITGALLYFKKAQGNVTLEEAVKSGLVAKTLADLGFDLPANFSAVDDLLPLLIKGKERNDKNGTDADHVKKEPFFSSNFSFTDLLGKGQKGLEKALTHLGIDLPRNVSASDILSALGKDKKKDLGETLSSLGIDGNLSNIFGKGGLDKDTDGGDFLHVLTLALYSLDDRNETKPDFPDAHKTRASRIFNQTGDYLTRPTHSFTDNHTHSFAHQTRSVPPTVMNQKMTTGKIAVGVEDVEPSQTAVSVEKKEQKRRFMEDTDNQTIVTVENILAQFNTSLAEIHPTFVEVNGTTPVLLAEIALPVKLSEKELDDLRNETSDVKNLRVFDDHLTVRGGVDDDDVTDTVPRRGTRTTDVPRSTRIETKSSALPENQSKQTASNAKQTSTVWKGSSTTTSSGSSTSSASTTTTNPSSTVTASSSTTTTTLTSSGTGSSTTTTVASDGSSTTTTAYTGPPTISTTADPAASTTTSSLSSMTSSAVTGSTSTTTTPKPTTTTSPYVYDATTDISGTYEPGDQKLENGTVIRPNGDTIYPNGTVKTSDGTVIQDGKKIDPDGTVHNPDGSTKLPNGTVIYPDNSAGAGSGGKSGDDAPTWVIPVIIVTVLLIGVGALGMIFFGVTSMMKGGGAATSTVNPYEVPKANEQWPNQRQPKPSADLPPPVADPVTTAQPQSFGATQTLHGAAAPNSLYFG